MSEFKDRAQIPLAVITGALSGIGYELAQIFAKNGFNLLAKIIWWRDRSSIKCRPNWFDSFADVIAIAPPVL